MLHGKSGDGRGGSLGLTAEPTHAARGVERYEKRRAEIVAAAIPVLNNLGFKGMRLTEVAERIGLRATGVTYYFPRKEELAVACFESALAIFHELLAEAEREANAARRVGRLIELFIARDAEVRRGAARPLASFSCLKALDGELYRRVSAGYQAMFRRVRALLAGPELTRLTPADRTMRTLALLEQLYWANTWLADYDLDEFPRIAARMTDIVLHGLALPGRAFDPGDPPLPSLVGDSDAANENFLRAATAEINAYGCRGASVERISASINVTKGAFYHYNEAKDDLIAACFRRSFGLIREVQREAQAAGGGDGWRQLTTAVARLVRFQLCPAGPLLRTSAIASVPPERRVEILGLSYKVARGFAAMISDAITEGSLRPVDPVIAAHLLSAAINAASDLRRRSEPEDWQPLVYARPLFCGILSA